MSEHIASVLASETSSCGILSERREGCSVLLCCSWAWCKNPITSGSSVGHLYLRTFSLMEQILYLRRNISLIIYSVILTEQGWLSMTEISWVYRKNEFGIFWFMEVVTAVRPWEVLLVFVASLPCYKQGNILMSLTWLLVVYCDSI